MEKEKSQGTAPEKIWELDTAEKLFDVIDVIINNYGRSSRKFYKVLMTHEAYNYYFKLRLSVPEETTKFIKIFNGTIYNAIKFYRSSDRSAYYRDLLVSQIMLALVELHIGAHEFDPTGACLADAVSLAIYETLEPGSMSGMDGAIKTKKGNVVFKTTSNGVYAVTFRRYDGAVGYYTERGSGHIFDDKLNKGNMFYINKDTLSKDYDLILQSIS